jgi:hypothetical protein
MEMWLAPREKSHVRRGLGRVEARVSAVRCSEDTVTGSQEARRHLIVTGICRLPVTDRGGEKVVGIFDGEVLPTLG